MIRTDNSKELSDHCYCYCLSIDNPSSIDQNKRAHFIIKSLFIKHDLYVYIDIIIGSFAY